MTAFGQRQVAQYFTQVNTYDVVEELTPALQGDPATIDKIYIRSPTTGAMVPLSAFAKWTTEPVAPLSISHQGQFPAVTISFNLAPGVALGQATAAIQKAEQELQLPPAVSTSFQGNAQAFQDSLSTVPLLILAALVVVYIILGMLYESFIHPLTILSTLPSAGFGALAMLMLFGYEFSLIALIGTILLIGIVKKNGIMMVDFAIAAERDEGLSTVEAIRKAALLRFRPIMMTTMAALLGGVPLMLGHGTGSELRQPLGYSMVGGLIVSQALTLFTTPVIYIYLDRLQHWLAGSNAKQVKASSPSRSRRPRRKPTEPASDRRRAASRPSRPACTSAASGPPGPQRPAAPSRSRSRSARRATPPASSLSSFSATGWRNRCVASKISAIARRRSASAKAPDDMPSSTTRWTSLCTRERCLRALARSWASESISRSNSSGSPSSFWR